MKKMNNKGFLLAESLVVSTFVVTVLVVLFVQFRTLYNNYKNSYDYNTVEGIYNLNTMKKYILGNQNESNLLSNQMTGGYVIVFQNGSCNVDTGLVNTDYCSTLANAMELETLIYASSNVSSIDKTNSLFTNSYKDFLGKINDSQAEGKEYRLIGQFKDGTYATIFI